MASKFNPEDLKNPLYEHSQVITMSELKVIYRALAIQFKDLKWWELQKRQDIKVAGGVIYEMLLWLQDGKPALKDLGENK